jgi:hypothetical protein
MKAEQDAAESHLVTAVVLSNDFAVSDFVHPNNNLGARLRRAFFVLHRPQKGHVRA